MDNPAPNPRDRARSAALGRTVKRREVTIEVAGVQYLVRAPSISEAADIRAAGGLAKQRVGKDGQTELAIDVARYTVRAMVLCTYVPETGERAFGLADEAEMLKWPMEDEFLDKLGGAAVGFMQGAEASAKNSERTPTG